jgi:hypothetical protein
MSAGYQIPHTRPDWTRLTWITPQAQFPTMPLPDSRVSDSLVPELFDPFFNCFSYLRFGVDDPYPIVRVECDGHESGFGVRVAQDECEGVFGGV